MCTLRLMAENGFMILLCMLPPKPVRWCLGHNQGDWQVFYECYAEQGKIQEVMRVYLLRVTNSLAGIRHKLYTLEVYNIDSTQ